MLGKNILWSLPPTDLNLRNNDVHVWRASLEQSTAQVQQLAKMLSEDEKIRAERFYFEGDKKHFIIGRGLLRIILGRYLGIAPNQLQFSYSSRGKPAVVMTDTSNTLQFNLSHSEELVLYAFTRDRKIGIDVEYTRPIAELEQLTQRFFSAREVAALRSLPPNEQQQAFFQAWTCKEAYLKATGEGLAQLEQVEVSLVPGEPCKLLNTENPQTTAHWSLQTLTPDSNYVAALAVEGHHWHLTGWQWSD